MGDPELLASALNDAGLTNDDVGVVFTEEIPSDPNAFSVGYFGPGSTLDNSPVPLTAAEATARGNLPQRHKIAVGRDLEPEVKLGLIRWALERARQVDWSPHALGFTDLVNDGLGPLAHHPPAAGSAVLWHTIPSIRDADSASGHLVTATFGPQFGRLKKGVHGSLYRTDRPRPDLDTLARRLVVAAAAQAETIKTLSPADLWPDLILRDLDSAAPGWWEALLADDGFTHLRKSTEYYIPTPEAIADAGENPATAWRPAEHHVDVTYARGMDVLAGLP